MSTEIKTGKVRFSYAHVHEPYAHEGQAPKYSVSLIIPKSDTKTLETIKAAIEAALLKGKEKLGGKIPKVYKNPLRDGDEERPDDENYEGAYFLNANSKTKPVILDMDREEIISDEEFYSGCFGRAALSFYAFNTSGNKGIAVGLNAIQKTSDGEKLSGPRTNAKDIFDDGFEDEDDIM